MAFVNFIGNNTYNIHGNVLTNSPAWRGFYNAAPRVLLYLNAAGQPMPAPMVDTVPCYDCGLVLPLNNIQIDHQRPQVSNDLEPICKVFRAMGLTLDGPAGPKGLHHVPTISPAVGDLAHAGVGTLQAKYTLNAVGKIYYTLADWSGLLGDNTLGAACMNHLVNLRPLYAHCNAPNRNVRHF
jgi:hypothetical protein